jgi:hypothetical protein
VKCGAGQRILVGTPVDRLAHQLLGRRIGHRAYRHVGPGQPGGVINAPRDAEIGQEDPLRLPIGVGQQDVGRLDIAVQQPAMMRIIQRRADRGNDRHRFIDRHPAGKLLAQQPGHIAAGHILHRNPKLAIVFTAVVDPHDVRMIQVGRQLGLPLEPRPILRIAGQFRRQHLQRVLARQPRMRRQEHPAHSARAQHPQDLVSGEHLTDFNRHGQTAGVSYRPAARSNRQCG